MFEFNNATKCLLELDAVGEPFTWCNGFDMQHTKSKLDRVFVNHNWAIKWPQVCPLLVFANSSDHAAILLELLPFEKGSKPFKFYNSWLHQSSFNDLFRNAWASVIVLNFV